MGLLESIGRRNLNAIARKMHANFEILTKAINYNDLTGNRNIFIKPRIFALENVK